MPATAKINAFLQRELSKRGLAEVSAVEAAGWLDQAGLLDDSVSRPGKPLRQLLRDGRIEGAEQRPQRPNGRWFITQPGGVVQDQVRTETEPTAAESVRRDPSPVESQAGYSPELKDAAAPACAALDVRAATADLSDLPRAPGLYTLQARSIEAVKALGLKERDGETALTDRVLYLGKAEDRLLDRLARKHFAIGETGRSTVRRTLAALLDLSVVPRPSRIQNPTRRQLMTATANFALVSGDDEWLSAWMREHLLIRAYATGWTPLGKLERAVGARLRPPLDQEKTPFWEANPWRSEVATARERKRTELRSQIGLV